MYSSPKDLNPIEQGFNEYKSYLKKYHDDPDISDHQYITYRALTALSPKMHTHFDSCGLDAKGYRARLAEHKLSESDVASTMQVVEDVDAFLLFLDL